MKLIVTKVKNFEAILQVFIINLRHQECMKIEDQIGLLATRKFMRDNTKQELIESTKFKDEKELMDIITNISKEFVYISKDQIVRWMDGDDIICTSAVYPVIRTLEKVGYMISVSLELLEKEDISKNRKLFIVMSHRLSRQFDFIYSAALNNPNDIFYNRDPENEDLLALLKVVDFSMPEEIQKHKENTLKGIEDFHYAIAIAQRGFKHKNIVSQIFISARWAIYYKFKKEKIWDHANFLMTVLDKDAVVRVLKLIQSNYVEKKIGYDKSLPKVELHELITIPFSKADIITLENMDSTDLPKMMCENLDLPFERAKEDFDKTERVQVRLLCNNDWNRVDWKTSELLDPDSECVHLD